MRSHVELLRSRTWLRWAALTLIAVGAAGCSADTARFNDNPFGSFTGHGRSDVTGSVSPAAAAPVARVESKPLSQGSVALPPPSKRAVAAVPAPAQAPRPAAQETWSWNGGTAIMVVPGDTVQSLSHKYNVPAAAIVQANGLNAKKPLKVGQRIVIPRHQLAVGARRQAAQSASAAASKIASVPAAHGRTHIVAPGENLIKIAAHYHVSLVDLAKANRIPPHTKVNLGDRLIIPGGRGQQTLAAAPIAPAQSRPVQARPVQARPAAVETPKLVAAEPVNARVVTPAAETPIAQSPVKAAEATGSMPGFRWPVRGRIIAAFGATPNGQQNEGINLAVPEGTPVKAAEDGVVAYAGNELKGYGNLVLVRHANGYVTAYAHASELLVKRNDPVKRGQVIARAGQTGTVSSPQLHFEIRKGSTPIDPTPFLDRGG